MRVLRLLHKVLARAEEFLVVIALSLMITLTFFQVVLRALYTHGHLQWANTVLGTVDWTEPFARLLVLWLTFLGASLLVGENRHIKIDFLSTLLPFRWLPLREIILSAVCVIISAFMLHASIHYVRMEMTYGGYIFLSCPTWVAQLILPAGFSIMLFRFFLRGIEQACELIKDWVR